MNLETKSTILMVPEKPLREEEITTIPNQDHTQRAVMQQMLRKIKQIRTTHRTEEMEDSITETDIEVPRSNLKESMMIKKPEVIPRDLDFSAECAQGPLTQTY